MYHIISVVLKNPDVLIESDPLEQILAYWKKEGTLTHIILSPVNIKNIEQYHSYPCDVAYHENGQADYISSPDTDLPLLFDMPQNSTTIQTQLNAYRLLLTFFTGTKKQIDTLLDTTEEIICKNMTNGSELMFAMPLSHLRGLESLIQAAQN